MFQDGIRCAICDDDYAFLKRFRADVEYFFAQKSLVCQCELFLTPSELLMATIERFDMVFLNVDTGYWDGINIARSIREAGINTLILFVSAHIQFAPQGYAVGAFRYLMKADLDATLPEALEDALARLDAPGQFLTLKSGKEEYRVPLARIMYAESNKRVITYWLEGWQPAQLSAYGKLSDLETQLAGKGFLRIHKSYLANMRYIVNIKNYDVVLKDGRHLQCSRQNYAAMLETLDRYQRQNGKSGS